MSGAARPELCPLLKMISEARALDGPGSLPCGPPGLRLFTFPFRFQRGRSR